MKVEGNVIRVERGTWTTGGELRSHAASISQLVEDVLPSIAGALQVPACWLHLVDEESADLVLMGSYGDTPNLLFGDSGSRAYASIAREVRDDGKPMVIEEPSSHSQLLWRGLRQAGYHCLIIAPLQSGETTIGFVGAASSAPKSAPHAIALLETFGKLVAIALSATIKHWRIGQYACLNNSAK